jgi:hypothetical protein
MTMPEAPVKEDHHAAHLEMSLNRAVGRKIGGHMRHWQPVRSRWSIASRRRRSDPRRGRSVEADAGRISLIAAHASSPISG